MPSLPHPNSFVKQVAPSVANQSNQQDSFSKSSSVTTAPTGINSSSVPSLSQSSNITPGSSGGYPQKFRYSEIVSNAKNMDGNSYFC